MCFPPLTYFITEALVGSALASSRTDLELEELLEAFLEGLLEALPHDQNPARHTPNMTWCWFAAAVLKVNCGQ